MNEKEIRDNIKALTVQIITPKERGTGLLIQYEKRLYVLTVRHVIYGKTQKEHSVEADEVKFIFYNQAKLYAINIKNFGELTLLELNPKELPLSNFGTVKFLEVEYEQNYYIRGFPLGLDKAHNFRAKCNDIERETFKIEIENLTNDTSGEDAIEYMKGVSGSGVFFSRDKKLYLVGLVNALANQSGTFNAVECLNLRKFLNKKTPPKKSYFNYLWLGLALVFGVLAFLFYPNSSELEVLAPKSVLEAKSTRLKPSIPSEKKRAVLHINKGEFSSTIESALSKKFILVWDEKKANYIIEVNSQIKQNPSTEYGYDYIKSNCQLDVKIIELQSSDIVSSKVYTAIGVGEDNQNSGLNCFEKTIEKLNFHSSKKTQQKIELKGNNNHIAQNTEILVDTQILKVEGSGNSVVQKISHNNFNKKKLCQEGRDRYQRSIGELEEELNNSTITELRENILKDLKVTKSQLELFQQENCNQ